MKEKQLPKLSKTTFELIASALADSRRLVIDVATKLNEPDPESLRKQLAIIDIIETILVGKLIYTNVDFRETKFKTAASAENEPVNWRI